MFLKDLDFDFDIVCLQNFLLADEDIGGRKSSKAKELGYGISVLSMFCCFRLCSLIFVYFCSRTSFLTEDGLFDMIRKSKPAKSPAKEEFRKKTPENLGKALPKHSPVKAETKGILLSRSIKSHISINFFSYNDFFIF